MPPGNTIIGKGTAGKSSQSLEEHLFISLPIEINARLTFLVSQSPSVPAAWQNNGKVASWILGTNPDSGINI